MCLEDKMFKNLIRKPFKGSVAYEWQIAMVVFSLFYPTSKWQNNRKNWSLKIWIDPYWNI